MTRGDDAPTCEGDLAIFIAEALSTPDTGIPRSRMIDHPFFILRDPNWVSIGIGKVRTLTRIWGFLREIG